jgi:hypothetical protein
MACHCTNQCPSCGSCCQVGCDHRGPAKGWTLRDWSSPSVVPCSPPSGPLPWPPGEITVMPKPLSEEDVRRVIREELARDRESRES